MSLIISHFTKYLNVENPAGAGTLGHLWGPLTTPHFRDVGSLLAAFKGIVSRD
jgi:hypothetical protein